MSASPDLPGGHTRTRNPGDRVRCAAKTSPASLGEGIQTDTSGAATVFREHERRAETQVAGSGAAAAPGSRRSDWWPEMGWRGGGDKMYVWGGVVIAYAGGEREREKKAASEVTSGRPVVANRVALHACLALPWFCTLDQSPLQRLALVNVARGCECKPGGGAKGLFPA